MRPNSRNRHPRSRIRLSRSCTSPRQATPAHSLKAAISPSQRHFGQWEMRGKILPTASPTKSLGYYRSRNSVVWYRTNEAERPAKRLLAHSILDQTNLNQLRQTVGGSRRRPSEPEDSRTPPQWWQTSPRRHRIPSGRLRARRTSRYSGSRCRIVGSGCSCRIRSQSGIGWILQTACNNAEPS